MRRIRGSHKWYVQGNKEKACTHSNLGHPDCNLTLPLTNNLISLINETNDRIKDNST
jgi:hypothetical protein